MGQRAGAMAATRPLSRFWELGKNIVWVGRNYADRVREMQSAVPSEQLLFLKPPWLNAPEGSPVLMPACSRNLHRELELGVLMSKRGRAVLEATAMAYVAGYALCLDMTTRDVQDECKKKGLPWTLAKSFTASCPVSALVPKEKFPDPHNLKLWLKVYDELRQDGRALLHGLKIVCSPQAVSPAEELVEMEEIVLSGPVARVLLLGNMIVLVFQVPKVLDKSLR
ncbi:Acylpyruvase FAHD1; mitochondrial [Camelus dromedarius]|uniref:Oxaloacetate tautomerase FAHD1, mitochondrial n=1 Tax=Camelus dromedarius TaxID=9838 RepID=A0A5N4C5G0_CAMDR|nr:Acylpyruvase FAHD1; mitochondrial [Camelus dromedarius]